MLQTILNTLAGVIIFDEDPVWDFGFYLSLGALGLALTAFIIVMEWNEPEE